MTSSASVAVRRYLVAVFALLPLLFTSLAGAVDYPTRAISLIVPYGAGGTTDISARRLAALAEPLLGQPVVIENRPGGGGINAMRGLAAAKADGYAVIATTSSPLFVTPALRPVGYDPIADFNSLLNYSGPYHGVLVRADSPYHSLDDLLAAAASGKRLTYGTAGALSGPRLSFTALARETSADLQHVPFSSASSVTAALLGGHIDIALVPAYRDMVRGERLRLLAVLDDSRDPDFPQVPTLTDAGYTIEFPSIVGLMVPRGVPAERVERLRAAFAEAAASEAFARDMDKLSQPVRILSGEQMDEVIQRNLAVYRNLAEELKR